MQSSNSTRYQELAEKLLSKTITPEERQEFMHWYNSGHDSEINLSEDFASDDNELKERIYSKIEESVGGSIQASRKSQNWYLAAASIVLVISLGLFYFKHKTEAILTHNTSLRTNDVLPGSNKAILTLSTGNSIVLEDIGTGKIAKQGNISITKIGNGKLVYSNSGDNSNTNASLIYNTLSTPKGGQYHLILPDGTEVWLNAASSLRYPAMFTGDEREVELHGEAYFEVAKNKQKPFKVISNDQVVEVLGTHFNVNAYTDEPQMNTTLLEGRVKIVNNRTHNSELLNPGQQASFGKTIKIVDVNAENAVAWKNGYFQFDHADIKTVMRQIERWYNVSVKYESTIPLQEFGGAIESNLSLLQVLKILEKSQVHFRVDGREVIVMP